MLLSTPFQQRLGALVLLYAIAASAWNIVGGYAGQVSVGHVVFFGCGAYAAMARTPISDCRRWSAFPPASSSPSPSPRSSVDRRCACRGIISAWRQSRLPRRCKTDRHQHDLARRRGRPERPDRAAQRLRSLLRVGAALLLSVPGRARDHAPDHLADDQQPHGLLPACDQGFRTCRALARRAGRPHQALRLYAECGSHLGRPARSTP